MTGYRTLVFNAIMALIALARVVFPDIRFPDDSEINKYLEAIWAVVTIFGNISLRFATKGPVGMKNPVCDETPKIGVL